VNMKIFPNLKWGTRDPVAFKDSELGLIRLRAFGIIDIRVMQPLLFINSLVGTQGIYTSEEIEEYLSRIIVSRFNDFLGEHIDTRPYPPRQITMTSLRDSRAASRMISATLHRNIAAVYHSITPPTEVQRAIDDKSRLGVFDDLNRLLQMKASMAMEKASESQGAAGSGMGAGLGLMMPAMFANMLTNVRPPGTEYRTIYVS